MKKLNLETLRAVEDALTDLLGQEYYEGDAQMFIEILAEHGFEVVRENVDDDHSPKMHRYTD